VREVSTARGVGIDVVGWIFFDCSILNGPMSINQSKLKTKLYLHNHFGDWFSTVLHSC
jgi:hypothetical protein